MELVGKRYRPILGTAFLASFAFAMMIQPAFSFFFRDEFWYQLASTAPSFFFPFAVAYVPTSLNHTFSSFLAHRTATEYDRLLASSCRLSVCLFVTLCIVALRVGVQG